MSEARRSPLLAQVLLLVGFLVLTAAGVATVIVPSLWSEAASDDDGAAPSDGERPAPASE